MDHSHQHNTSSKILKISFIILMIEFVGEFIIWYWIDSVSIVSDSLHTLSAIGWVIIAMIAIQISKRSSNYRYSFGYYRAEVLWALLNSFLLVGMIGFVLYMAIMRLQNPIGLPTWPMIWVWIGALLLEWILLKITYEKQKKSLNMKGAFSHILMTFFGSIGIIVSALVIKFTWFDLIDPLMGVMFSWILLWMSWWIGKESIHILLEGVPSGYNIKSIIQKIESIKRVINVHHIHIRSIWSWKNIATLHAKIDNEADNWEITWMIHETLIQENIFFSSVQCEKWDCLDGEESSFIDVTSKT
jgi:cobalt-zinc-cadmium efflux system protein